MQPQDKGKLILRSSYLNANCTFVYKSEPLVCNYFRLYTKNNGYNEISIDFLCQIIVNTNIG